MSDVLPTEEYLSPADRIGRVIGDIDFALAEINPQHHVSRVLKAVQQDLLRIKETVGSSRKPGCLRPVCAEEPGYCLACTAVDVPAEPKPPHTHVWGPCEDRMVAVCECGVKSDEWYCPDSPDHLCHYSKSLDSCDYCGDPEERK